MSEAPTPQLAPTPSGLLGKAVGDAVDVLRRQAHHGAAGGVERAGIGVGQADADRRFRRRADLFRRRHGLDPGDFGAARLQAVDLLGKGIDRLVVGERAERHQQFAGRSDRAGDDHLAAGFVGDAAGDFGGPLVELMHPVLRMMQLQPMAGAAEGVGEDDVGAGIDEALMQRRDRLRRRLVRAAPALRRPPAPWRTGWCRWRRRRAARLSRQSGRRSDGSWHGFR